MALTLAESAKLTQDMLQRGVIETIVEESPMLRYLGWIAVEGNSFKYNQENTLGGAAFYAVNATWAEGTATFTQKQASLAILGGDADVDNFIQRTRSNLQDQRAIQTVLKAKEVARKWEQTMVTGDTATDANAFDGLKKLTPAGQTMYPAAAGGSLTLALLDELIDLVKGGKPSLLLMSKRTRRKLKSLLTASTHYVEQGADQFGRQVMFYDGIPVEVSDFQPDNEPANNGTGSTFSSIYAIQFSDADGVVGLTNGGIETVDVGQLESKDGSRVRIRWYVGAALLRDSAIARMNGVAAA
jgi:HK97 family phage major capsid protein